MTYKLNILKNANKDLDWFRKHDRTSYIKCFDLVREVMEAPSFGDIMIEFDSSYFSLSKQCVG